MGFEGSEGGNDGIVPGLGLDISVEFVRGESDDRPSGAPLQQLADSALQLALAWTT